MPQKKPRRTEREPERTTRIRTLARSDVERSGRLVGDLAAQLAALAKILEEQSIREIEIDGVGLFERGVDQIERYIDNVSSGVSRAQRERRRAKH